MPKKAYFCYACDNEFTVITKGTDDVEFCPICGCSLEHADCDDQDEE